MVADTFLGWAVNRAGEEPGGSHYRVDRFFSVDNDWFFSTRESTEFGPYASKEDAERALQVYVRDVQRANAADVSELVVQTELGLTELRKLNVSSAWLHLDDVARGLDIEVDANADLFSYCNEILLAVAGKFQDGDTRLAGLSRDIREYGSRHRIRPFPLSGMLEAERLYLKHSVERDVYCCQILETGDLVVADAAGNVLQEKLTGLPLDARMAVSMLISKLQGTMSMQTPVAGASTS